MDHEWMSDEFLKEDNSKKPTQTSLVPQSQREKLVQALATPISNNSIGAKLMAKMGYKEGKGLGTKSDGMIEPIAIDLDVKAIGIPSTQTVLKRSAEEDKIEIDSFRNRQSNQKVLLQQSRDLSSARNVCRQLDLEKQLDRNMFWTVDRYDLAEGVKDELEMFQVSCLLTKISEFLVMITNYLRHQHFFCQWCGERFKDENDLESNCPGSTRELHE